MTRKSAYPRFVRIHLLTLFGILGVIGVLNVLGDPFDYFRPQLDGTIDPYKKRSATRYARANVVANGEWDVIFCGASRTEIGFDPEHPAFDGQKVYNFGLAGAKFTEIWFASKYAIECNPSLRTLFVEMHPSYFNYQPLSGRFLTSRFGPHPQPVNYGIGQLLGSLATERSVSALSKWSQGKHSEVYTSLGLRVRAIRPPDAIPWDWFEAEMSTGRRQRAAQRMAHQAYLDDPNAPWLDLSTLDVFPQLLDLAQNQGTQIKVVISPSHETWLAQLIDEGHYSQVNDLKRRFAKFVGEARPLADGRASLVVYDFLVDDEFNAEPIPRVEGQDTRWHWEGGHFRVELGNRMLELIASDSEPATGTFGAQLTPETIDAHLVCVANDLARRLPTIAIVNKHMDSEQIVHRLRTVTSRVAAIERANDGPTTR